MTALFPQNTPAPAGVPQGIREVFDKGKWWRQADGTWVKVKHMSPGHRANVARMLMRDARAYAFRYVLAGDRYLHDAPDEVWAEYENESDRIMADPEKWMRGTKLYRRLTEKSRPDMQVDDNDPRYAADPREDMSPGTYSAQESWSCSS